MQKFIVEGKDAIALAVLCKDIYHLKPPLGYADKNKFQQEFVKSAIGFNNVRRIFKMELESSDVSNIGVIVDANEQGVQARFNSLFDTLKSHVVDHDILAQPISSAGVNYYLKDGRTVGIWIMPNNSDNGYLEHFMSDLIPPDDNIWQFAQDKVEEMIGLDYCKITNRTKQKALIHTFLAWQKQPGKPIGQAISAKYLFNKTELTDNFVNWFQNTFELEK